jgi:hypothetical protein
VENLNKWSEDKPLGLAIVAQQLAYAAEYCFECAEQIKKKEGFIFDLHDPKLGEWLGLYKRHYRVIKLFDDTFLDSAGFIEEAKDACDLFSEGLKYIKEKGMARIRAEYEKLSDKAKEEAEKEFQKVKEFILEGMKNLYDMSINDIAADINNEHEEELERRIKRDINKPEIKFLLQVSLPCTLLYKIHPLKLLRKARSGDFESLEKLVRLDSSVIHEKRIAEYIHSKRNNQLFQDKIASAISGSINEKVSRRNMKVRIAGLISYFTMAFGSKFNEPVIRELFDAIAKDKGVGNIDTDLPDAPETFAKGIQRERCNWRDFLNNN